MTQPQSPRSWMHDDPAPRRFNKWGGNPRGTIEDPLRCIESVHDEGRSPLSHQCWHKRGKGLDGLYCGIHARRYPATRSTPEPSR